MFGCGQHLHAGHAQVLEDLRADAVGAQYLRRDLCIGRVGDVLDTLADIVGLRDSGRTWTLRDAMKRIAEEGTGIVIVLRDHATPRELADAVSALGQRVEPAANAPVAPQVLRTYSIGAQILKDLGVTRMQVLSTPKQLQGIAAFGLEITGYVAE